METFKITTEYKKNVVEIDFWTKDDITIRRETGWRWGTGYITVQDEDEKENLMSDVDSEEVNVYDYEFELDNLDDGCWEDVEYPEDMSEEEQERLNELWDEDSYSAWEEDGWSVSDSELWFNGPIKLEKVEDENVH